MNPRIASLILFATLCLGLASWRMVEQRLQREAVRAMQIGRGAIMPRPVPSDSPTYRVSLTMPTRFDNGESAKPPPGQPGYHIQNP